MNKGLIFLLIFTVLVPVQAQLIHTDPLQPQLNGEARWRVGYYQGGPLNSYQVTLQYFIRALIEKSWLPYQELPEPLNSLETRSLWEWLSTTAHSPYIEFVEDAYYDLNWDSDNRPIIRQQIIDRLQNQRDLNLMLAFGTWAGQDLANDEHSTPLMVLSVSDAIASGIVESAEDSGRNHVHAYVSPQRYERQVRLFHRIFRFNRLGIVYENTTEGRSYAGLPQIERVQAELGFSIVPCFANFANIIPEEAHQNVLQCHERLASEVDAFYLTIHRGVTLDNLDAVLAPLKRLRIPVFAQLGSQYVRRGALLSVARVGYHYEGLFYAETAIRILRGTPPRQLNQIFEAPLLIAINTAVARLIGYQFPLPVLMLADEIYESISPPSLPL